MRAMSVLVVDDDTMNRELLQRMLTRMGWIVSEAPDGRTAIALCGNNHYELVMMDFFMPELDGVSTARAIRTIYDRAGYKTLLLAVTGSDYGEEEGVVFDGFLTKPFVLDELASAIASAQTALKPER
ncbi:hypothetical protein MASR2M48_09700 [Spirochaetota bacterium]|jgi:CheY-like chemotaxis protein